MVFFPVSLGTGLSVAGSVFVAQYTGTNEPDRAEQAAGLAAKTLFVVLSAAGVVFIVSEPIVSVLISADPENATRVVEVGT